MIYDSSTRRDWMAKIHARATALLENPDSLLLTEAMLDFEDVVIALRVIELHDEVLDIALGNGTIILMLNTGEGIEIDSNGNYTQGVL